MPASAPRRRAARRRSWRRSPCGLPRATPRSFDSGGHRLDGGPSQPVKDQPRDVGMARQIGRPSGRLVSSTRTRWSLDECPASDARSSVEGSIQCTSSRTTSTGLRAARLFIRSIRAARVRLRRTCGGALARRSALHRRNAQQAGDQRGRLSPGRMWRSRLRSCPAGCGRIVGAKAGGDGQLLDDRATSRCRRDRASIDSGR